MKPCASYTKAAAVFSPCRRWRYTLDRWWSPFAWHEGGRYANFLMLNPSTADETVLDPTVARCVGFARRWGYDGLVVTNIFACRGTDPKCLYAAEDPVGPENNEYVQKVARQASLVVCAWGVHGVLRGRGRQVAAMLTASEIPLYCLGVTKAGHPRHPLYLSNEVTPAPFTVP